jgi:predicted DsbA family dithiol-disulfide isomerase
MTETVRFHFDPLCPWAWQGAHWIAEVENVRDVAIEWRLFSLFLVNEHHEEFDEAVAVKMLMPLRALALARRYGGNDAVRRAYFAMGRRRHEEGAELTAQEVGAAMEEAGLDREMPERSMTDPSTLDDVRREHEAVVKEVGAFGVPTIVLPSGKGIFGPVTALAPLGEEAGEFWDHVRWLAEKDGFFELKRNRDRKPGMAA